MNPSPREPEILSSEIVTDDAFGGAPYDPQREPPRVAASGKPFPWGCLLGGCFTASVLVVGLLVVVGFGTYRFYKQQVAQYTSEQSRQIPTVEVSPAEMKEIESRVETFQKKVEQGEAREPLVLTAKELNAMINQQEQLRGKVYVTIKDDLIQAEVSFPTDALPGAQGRYFNASASVNASLENGVLVVNLDSAEVKGQAVPEAIMDQIRKENLAKDMNKNPEFVKSLKKFERLVIEGDKVILTPKAYPPEEEADEKEDPQTDAASESETESESESASESASEIDSESNATALPDEGDIDNPLR